MHVHHRSCSKDSRTLSIRHIYDRPPLCTLSSHTFHESISQALLQKTHQSFVSQDCKTGISQSASDIEQLCCRCCKSRFKSSRRMQRGCTPQSRTVGNTKFAMQDGRVQLQHDAVAALACSLCLPLLCSHDFCQQLPDLDSCTAWNCHHQTTLLLPMFPFCLQQVTQLAVEPTLHVERRHNVGVGLAD